MEHDIKGQLVDGAYGADTGGLAPEIGGYLLAASKRGAAAIAAAPLEFQQ